MADTRQHILEQSSQMMNRVGIKSVSIDDICRELGISKKTFYVYFETKDQLVEALLHRFEEIVEADMQRKTAGKSVLDLCLGFLTVMRETRDVRRVPPLMYDLEKYYPQLFKQHLAHVHENNTKVLYRYLKQGKEEGFFRADLDVDKTAAILSYLHHEMMNCLPKVAEKNKNKVTQDVKYAIDIFMRGIISEEGTRQVKMRIEK